jgi:hypothetical protein
MNILLDPTNKFYEVEIKGYEITLAIVYAIVYLQMEYRSFSPLVYGETKEKNVWTHISNGEFELENKNEFF